MLENYWDRKTLLEKLGISQSTLSRRIREDFPHTKMGNRIFFNKEDVYSYLENHTINKQPKVEVVGG
tara:strand:- start:580 stop:780 length:201 start_codon:yes stop_codon:yes gene_type:complete